MKDIGVPPRDTHDHPGRLEVGDEVSAHDGFARNYEIVIHWDLA